MPTDAELETRFGQMSEMERALSGCSPGQLGRS